MIYHTAVVKSIVLLMGCSLSVGCGPGDDTTESKTEIPSRTHFTDITSQSKLNFVHDPGVDGSYFMPESIGSGGALFDYDNDGDLDIYLINGARHGSVVSKEPPLKNRLFRQESDGTFEDVTEQSGLGDLGYGMGVAIADIDNDGDLDVYISNYGPDALYRNDGDGTFTNISKKAGIHNPFWGCSVVFFDYDLDGYLDIYVTNYVDYDTTVQCTDRGGRLDYCGPAGFQGTADVLYHNNRNGTFTDVSEASGIAKSRGKGLGVVAADFNDDAYPDIYVANDGEPNFLWINRKNGTFENRALVMGAAVNALGRPEAGMGIALGDIDNDGKLDIFVTHLRGESNTLYHRTSTLGFQDDTSPAGLSGPSIPYTGFGTGFFDYDNDGDLDLAVVNGRVTRGPLLTHKEPVSYWDDYAEPNLLFENDGAGHFQDLSSSDIDFCRQIENSRGLAFGDIDNDGDLDMLVTNEGGSARLLRNDVKKDGHWVVIRVIDPKLKRDAYGAQVTVIAGDKRYFRTINAGSSYLCSNDPRAHFGLGGATAADEVLVQWPDGKMEKFVGIRADQFTTIQKGQSRRTSEK